MPGNVANGWLPKCVNKTKTSNLGTKLRIFYPVRLWENGYEEKYNGVWRINKSGNILQIDFLKKFCYNIYIRNKEKIVIQLVSGWWLIEASAERLGSLITTW